MSPEDELAVIRHDACQYKGVSVDLPEPVAKYVEDLLAERAQHHAELDAMAEGLYRPQPATTPQEAEWVRLDQDIGGLRPERPDFRERNMRPLERVEHLDA